ncbi:MAG: DMP19 family protein [Paludibacteraceae bacterium]|nr:DMP19 family protein [Paludibacteraceae bacterium]
MRNELIMIVATIVVAGILYMFFQKRSSSASNETTGSPIDNMRSSLDSAYAFQGDIWEQEDRIIQYHISNALCEKSNYGEEFSKLNDYEKVFLVMYKLEMEVNNGGFDQFFDNTDGHYNDILVSSAEAIKAYDIAKICRKALAIYAKNVDAESVIEKRAYHDSMEYMQIYKYDPIFPDLNKCDDAFYASENSITGLSVQYAKENKEQFRGLIEEYILKK